MLLSEGVNFTLETKLLDKLKIGIDTVYRLL